MEELIMNLEQVKALNITGLSDADAKKIADASGDELKTYIPKSRFDEVNTAKKSLEEDNKKKDKQIEDIKKSAGDNEELTKQIETLQTENKEAQKKYEADLKDLKISNAIELALGDNAQDAEIVAGLFDKSKLILGDDGKVSGLEEQLKGIKENKPFLFKEDKPADNPKPQPKPGFQIGNPNPNPTPEPGQRLTMKDAIAAKLQSQMGQQNNQ